jgi:hypothetical protein
VLKKPTSGLLLERLISTELKRTRTLLRFIRVSRGTGISSLVDLHLNEVESEHKACLPCVEILRLLHVADPIACRILTYGPDRPSIDETHRNFAYRAQPSMTSLNQSTSTTRGDDRDRDQFNPTPSQTNLHRVYTNESHHSREPLTTPHMDTQAAFQSSQSQQAPTIRPIKEADYGNPNHASPQLRQGGGFAYPPGQYQSIPLNDHATGEKSGKRGIAGGGGERYSRNGTKEGESSRTGIMVVRLVISNSLIRSTSW